MGIMNPRICFMKTSKTMKNKEAYCKCKNTRPKDVMLDRCLICNKRKPKKKKFIPEYQGTMYY